MDNLKMHSLDGVQRNIDLIGKLFPNAITEVKRNGKVEHAIDFDVLRQELSDSIVEGREERYQFTWPDKKKAMLAANAPITATLRPVVTDSVGKDGTPGGFDSENLYIEGDNLEVLKLLQETYLGKVKMIYIDPPYNTGNDFVYNDEFGMRGEEWNATSGNYDDEGNQIVGRLELNTESNGRFHTDWLNMIYPRLKISRDLLAKDGVLAISIGFHEMCNLLKMCQDLFSDRQVFPVTVKTSGGKPNGAFNISNEYVVFVVPKEFIPMATEDDMKEYASPYHGMNLATFTQDERPNQAYPIYVSREKGNIVGCGKTLAQRMSDGDFCGHAKDFIYPYDEAPTGTVAVWPVTNKGEQCVWRLIPERLLGDWKKGYIKVVPVNSTNTSNKYTVQYLSGGIIEKIQAGEVKTYRISDDPEIPTIEILDYKTAGSGIASIWDDKDFYTAKGNADIKKLFDKKVFSYPKPVDLVGYILKKTAPTGSLVLDFFSGSATMAQAIMEQNALDNGKRKYILVQMPEPCENGSEAARAGYKNICEIGKERIRRAGKQILSAGGGQLEMSETQPDQSTPIDIGFRCLRLDSSNMENVYYTPEETQQQDLFSLVDNVKSDRTPEDLLFQVMLDLGVLLSSPIEVKEIAGKKVFNVADGFLLACFDHDVTEETVKAIAQMKPYYAVFRDSSMANDSVATNFDQIFETYSPETVRKVL